MTTLRQAAQDLLDKIDERGASPLDWPEYSELQAALAAPEQEPVATVITHRGGVAISGTSKFPAVGTKLYAAPVEPYDQQALELCGACGWKAVMPGEPCFICNMQTKAQQEAAPVSAGDTYLTPAGDAIAALKKAGGGSAMNLPSLPNLTRFTTTHSLHRGLIEIVQAYGQQCRAEAMEEAAQCAESGVKYAKDGYQISDEIRSLKS